METTKDTMVRSMEVKADRDDILIKYNDQVPVVLCIGDSITEGFEQENYPALLQDLLQEGYHVYNHGVSGTTITKASLTPYTSTTRYMDSLRHDHADYIILMFGTNDTNITTWIDPLTFYADYDQVIDQYRSLYPNAKMALGVVIEAFDTTNDGDGIANYDIQPQYIDDVNQMIHQLALDHDIDTIDLYDQTKDHLGWYDGDGIHPNIVGKRFIAQQVFQWIGSNQ